MELARGTVTDRPWGRTLASLALRALTGQVTVTADGKQFAVALADGVIVGATSPLAADAAVRIALTGGLISSTQVTDISRRQAAAPGRDEVDVIAEAAKLGPDHAMRLRRRALAQRAARTFSLERGDFVVEDTVTVPVVDGAALDIRTVVYLGARGNLSEARLKRDLAAMGDWFKLKADAAEDIPLFGFTPNEQPVIDLLVEGAALADLEAAVMDPRAVHAVIYSLVSLNACELTDATRQIPRMTAAPVSAPAPVAPPPKAAQPAPQAERGLDEPTFRKPNAPTAAPKAATPTPKSAQPTPPAPPMPATDPPTQMRPRTASRPPPPSRNRAESLQASDVLALIGERLKLLDQKVDHYTLLGVAQDAPSELLRKSYFGLAKQLHPDRLASLGISDVDRNAQRLFAEVNTAFAVLNDPARRADYTSILKRGGAAAVAAEQQRAEEMAMRVIDSEEAYRRGEQALKRDQIQTAVAEFSKAIELNPTEADYHAALAWSQFCAAPDKMAVASPTRAGLQKALALSPRAVSARFYLGRVERMLGKDREALAHFQEVIKLQPNHPEAKSEARVIEQRLASQKK